MYCDRCGAPIEESQNFCRACGKPAGAVPPVPPPSRLAGHVRLLGILWIAFSAFRLIPAAAMLLFGRFWIPHIPADAAVFVHPFLMFMGYWTLLGSLLGFVAGWGLLERQPWGRTLTLLLGCFALIDPPFGTALGIYTLWVLLPGHASQEYARLSRAV
ncbi:MAG TPA: zinc ribbon domain-containing protein [Bryobacteraceae bacterium]|nr:zinc ribbon domain-containing protein [Bryobacteraceae bacterium]